MGSIWPNYYPIISSRSDRLFGSRYPPRLRSLFPAHFYGFAFCLMFLPPPTFWFLNIVTNLIYNVDLIFSLLNNSNSRMPYL